MFTSTSTGGGRPGPLTQAAASRSPVERMEQVGDRPHHPHLVGLERPDEMPPDVPGELSGPLGDGRCPVLAEVPVPLLVQRQDLSSLRPLDTATRVISSGSRPDLRAALAMRCSTAWRLTGPPFECRVR